MNEIRMGEKTEGIILLLAFVLRTQSTHLLNNSWTSCSLDIFK
jgi:hypothetical protein